jgi:hypothetical protein
LNCWNLAFYMEIKCNDLKGQSSMLVVKYTIVGFQEFFVSFKPIFEKKLE